MRLKTLVITVALLAVLSLAVALLRRPAPPASADARINQPLVAPATLEQAAKLRLTEGGKTVELARTPDGTWRVPSYHDLPADFAKLSGFVTSLTEAKLQRLVTSNPERLSRLDFKDTKVVLLDRADQPVVELTLGKSAEIGGGRYVRFGSESKAYLANLNAWLDVEARNWAQADLLGLKAEDIAKVEIPLADGTIVTASRAKPGDPWAAANPPAGQSLKDDRVSAAVSSLVGLRFTDTTALDDPALSAARTHARRFTLTTFDQRTLTVALGRKPEEKKLKAPAPATDGRTGPAALGSVADLNKKDDAKPADGKKEEPALTPEFETIPAGPVFALITHSDANAAVNALMQKRGVQIAEYTFTSLPQKPEDLFQAASSTAERN